MHVMCFAGLLFYWTACFSIVGLQPQTARDLVRILGPLVDPVKLATLGSRGANPRICKITYWLEVGRRAGIEPHDLASSAILASGMRGEAASLTISALVRNRTIAERLGCLSDAGMADLRKGQSPTIQKGPYIGQELHVDHIIPRSVCPELDNMLANLELMPAKLNLAKGSRIGDRQVDLARKLRLAGLLSEAGLTAILSAQKSEARPDSPR